MTDTPSAAHTPLPWDQSHRRDSTDMYSTEIYCADGDTIATIAWYPRPKDANGVTSTYREANAAFIVHACNSHYQLVDVLQQIATQDACDMILDPDWARRIARAALTQATGGASADPS